MTPRRISGQRTVEDILRRHFEKENQEKGKPHQDDILDAPPDLPQDTATYWTIPNVQYRNGVYTVDLGKELLANGASKTQDQWSQFSQEAQARKECYVADFPLYHALFTTLFRMNDPLQQPMKEEIRTFLKEKFNEHWLMTLTRIQYTPSGKDKVIHNHNLPDQYEVEENMVGPDGFIKTIAAQQAYHALLGTDNIHEINEVYRWITGKDTYIWRLNNKPKALDERVSWFGAFSVWSFLVCGRVPVYSSSGLGVRVAREK